MAEKSYWFDDGEEHSSNEIAEYFFGAFETGVNVYGNPNSLLVEKTSGMNIKVNPGIAYINGRYYKNDDDLIITLTSYAGSIKYVRIVLRVDLPNKEIKAKVIEGASLPELTRTNDIFEISLAKIEIPAGASNLPSATLTDERSNSAVCGFFRFAGHEAQRVPTGTIQWYAKNTPPAGWLVCDGSAVSRSTYSDLFAVIGTTFGAGNGSTTFNLPDLRGEFIRGWDNGRGVDDGRGFGSNQAGTSLKALQNSASKGVTLLQNGENATTETSEGRTDGSSMSYTGTRYTVRPRNIALLPIIKI